MTDRIARPSAWTSEDLSGAERALLMNIRQWFQDGTIGSMASMRARLDRAGIPRTAILPLFAMLGGFAVTGVRQPSIAAPAEPRVSLDEAAMLDALAAFQTGEPEAAGDAMGRWLPPLVCSMALDNARHLSEILRWAGIHLPRRRTLRLAAVAAE